MRPASSLHSQLFPHVFPEAGKGERTAVFRGFSASKGFPGCTPGPVKLIMGLHGGDAPKNGRRSLLMLIFVKLTNIDSILKSRDITLSTKVHLVNAVVFPVVMYGRESWTIKKAERQRIDDFKLWCWRRLESPLDCKEVQPVHPKGDQSWMFIGKTDVEAETPILWPPDAES